MFYCFIQNNSGGHFDRRYEIGIGPYVIVEADDATEANIRAECIGLYFNGVELGSDCECCGDRWYPIWNSEAGEDSPMIYGKPIEEYKKSWFADVVFVHYKDRSFESYDLQSE